MILVLFKKVDKILNVSEKTINQNTSFTISFKRTMNLPLKLLQIYQRYGVDVNDDVITPKAIRCANDKIFWYFDISEPTSDLLQNDLKRKSSLIIITDVNMTSKRAFLQKVTFLLNSTTKR